VYGAAVVMVFMTGIRYDPCRLARQVKQFAR
jgi:hypothetical protein